ncbi:MAG: hypothetical protein U0231_04245 [Nitrospiraceae bacterium]
MSFKPAAGPFQPDHLKLKHAGLSASRSPGQLGEGRPKRRRDQLADVLSHDFLGGPRLYHGQPGQIHRPHRPVEIQDLHALRLRLDDRPQKRFTLFQVPLKPLPLRDVDDGRQHPQTVLRPNRIQPDLDRKHRAVTAKSIQFASAPICLA